MILFLLVAALVLGSFVVKQVSLSDYPLALAQTLFVIAVLLVALSWLWSPRSGFVGLGHMLSRYLMTPRPAFRALGAAARGARRAGGAAAALPRAGAAAHAGPAVGARRRVEERGSARASSASARSSRPRCRSRTCASGSIPRWSLSPAMLLHLKLLTQMVGHFYDAKRREEAQRQRAYTQAIYETGARLTHDVKNLLQSLRSLCAAVETSSAERGAGAAGADAAPAPADHAAAERDARQAARPAAGGHEPGGRRDLVGCPAAALRPPQRPLRVDRRAEERQAARGALRQRRRQSHRERAQQGGGHAPITRCA